MGITVNTGVNTETQLMRYRGWCGSQQCGCINTLSIGQGRKVKAGLDKAICFAKQLMWPPSYLVIFAVMLIIFIEKIISHRFIFIQLKDKSIEMYLMPHFIFLLWCPDGHPDRAAGPVYGDHTIVCLNNVTQETLERSDPGTADMEPAAGAGLGRVREWTSSENLLVRIETVTPVAWQGRWVCYKKRMLSQHLWCTI